MNTSTHNLPCQRGKHSSGFTLIELMVTIAVLAIIVGFAAPNISNQLANQRVKSTAATLANALKEAKVESVIRRQNITVVLDIASTPQTITLGAVKPSDNSITEIASYTLNERNTVTQSITPNTVTTVVLQPNKMIAGGAEVVYSVCDGSSTNEIPRQVRISSIATVDILESGSC